MKSTLILFLMIPTFTLLKLDFSDSETETWSIINDGVMGGLSKGRVIGTNEGMLFFGNVSLENNGGFTSYRSPFQRYDLGEATTLTIRYRSEGMAMGLQLDVYQRFYYPYFKINLPVATEWTELTVPLSEVSQYRMGYSTGKKLTREALERIIRIGFISNEKRAGDFKLEVDYVVFE